MHGQLRAPGLVHIQWPSQALADVNLKSRCAEDQHFVYIAHRSRLTGIERAPLIVEIVSLRGKAGLARSLIKSGDSETRRHELLDYRTVVFVVAHHQSSQGTTNDPAGAR
jgi:hypothetical protein